MANSLLTPEQNEKVKKSLLRFFIFTVCMIFAGLTSGYLVSQGDIFWVSVRMPMAFQLSTTAILLSSLFLIIAQRALKKNKTSILKMSLGVAMVLGLAFGYLQYKGWGQLFDRGATLSDFIINHTGQYGKHYKFYHQQKEITYDNDHFYWRSDEISPELKDQMVQLCKELEAGTKSGDKKYDLTNYGKDLVLKYHGEVLSYFDRSLKINNEELDPTQAYELRYFSEAVVNGRGDFMMVGEYGVDFWIYYKGDQIEYENRKFYRNGKLLSPKLQNDLQTQKNTASSYVYAFTFVHLLHWFGGAVALIVMLIRGIGNKYTEENNLGLRLGSTYWHFLGILWIYLYLFLIYIH